MPVVVDRTEVIARRGDSVVRRVDDFLRKSVLFQQDIREWLEARRASLRIRRKLLNGGLPYDRDGIIIGRRGCAGHCEGCERPLRTQLVMEIPNGDKPPVYLHADCFVLWDSLRRIAGVTTVDPHERATSVWYRVADLLRRKEIAIEIIEAEMRSAQQEVWLEAARLVVTGVPPIEIARQLCERAEQAVRPNS